MKMPVAHLEENNARIVPGPREGAEGFSVVFASGESIGLLANPPDASSFISDRAFDVPQPSWTFQGGLAAYAELDKQSVAITSDQSLSVWGRNQKLEAPKDKALYTVGFVMNKLQEHETQLENQEAQRYGVPPIAQNDFVGALRENEIRTAIRAMPQEDRLAFFENLNTGTDHHLMLAVLHSPVKFGVMEKLASNGWKKAIDAADPMGLERIELEKKSIDWAKRALLIIRTRMIQKTGYSREQIFAKMHPHKLTHAFGFLPAETVRLERVLQLNRAG
jgi:hypothetical protein